MSLQTEQQRISIIEERMTDAALKKKIFVDYKLALDEIRKLVAHFYEQYSVDGELDMAAAQKYGRLDKLEKAIADILRDAGNKQVRTTKKLITDIYQESYYRTAYGIESEVLDGWQTRRA